MKSLWCKLIKKELNKYKNINKDIQDLENLINNNIIDIHTDIYNKCKLEYLKKCLDKITKIYQYQNDYYLYYSSLNKKILNTHNRFDKIVYWCNQHYSINYLKGKKYICPCNNNNDHDIEFGKDYCNNGTKIKLIIIDIDIINIGFIKNTQFKVYYSLV